MSDLGPMEPCRRNKRGRHHLSYVLPEDSTGDLTVVCDLCGSMRRVPAAGSIAPAPLDTWDAADILEAVRRR